MTRVEESVADVKRLFAQVFDDEPPVVCVTLLLIDLMHFCDHTRGVSWTRCVEAARRQLAKEIQEDVDARPLPAK